MSEIACIVDLETADTVPSAAILTIGAVVIDLETSEEYGSYYKKLITDPPNGTVSIPTMLWWGRQPEAARKEAFEPPGREALDFALYEFRNFYQEHNCKTIWGNGATFDVSMMENAYQRIGVACPWNFYDVRDLRTLQHLVGDDVRDDEPFHGVKHHAMHDAYHEACWAAKMWQIARAAIDRLKEHN